MVNLNEGTMKRQHIQEVMLCVAAGQLRNVNFHKLLHGKGHWRRDDVGTLWYAEDGHQAELKNIDCKPCIIESGGFLEALKFPVTLNRGIK